MKKIFFFISIFFLLNPLFIKADEIDDCYNDYLYSDYLINDYRCYLGSSSYCYTSNSTTYDTPEILLEANSSDTFYFHIFDDTFTESFTLSVFVYDENKNLLPRVSSNINLYFYQIPVTLVDDYTFSFNLNNVTSNFTYISFYFSNSVFSSGNIPSSFAFANIDLSTCPSLEDPTPVEPSFDLEDTEVVSSFYSLCLDKISLLTGYFFDNYILFFCFTLILCFVVFFLIFWRWIS